MAAPSPDEQRALFEVKLRPPPLRAGVVDRTRLVDLLLSSRQARIVTVVAPAGYGKTTVLTQWQMREARPTAWLSVDRDDNDPATLLSHIAAALHRAGMLPDVPVAGIRLTPDLVIPYGIARITSALEARGACGVLMLDHVDGLRSRASNDAVAELAARLPQDVQLAVASRTSVRLPVGTLRAQGALFELTAADLAMDKAEARALLENLGVEVGDDLDDLVRHTEGWPVGLYLAGLAATAGSPRRPAAQVGGDDRYLADYLRHQVLERLSGARISFLIRTSILERFCGRLCDAVLGSTDSARTIERLESSNLLVVPLDRTGEWYRYHRMLRDFLQAELIRREPDVVAGLHARAATWFDANGMPELAIAHAQSAGDDDMAARIVARVARATYGMGRTATVFEWLRWFEQENRAGRYPAIAALGALAHALAGDERGADRWGSVLFAARDDADGKLPDAAMLVRAILARGGTGQIRADAEAVRRAEPPDPEWLPAAFALEGLAYLWEGDADRADSLLGRAVATGEWSLGMPAATLALAARALIAIGRGHWNVADDLVTRSQELIVEHGLDRYLTSGLAFAVAARCAVRRGHVDGARRLLARAAAIRPLLTTATPGISVQTLVELAKAHSELSDIAGARLVLREASDILAKRPRLGLLPNQYDKVKRHLGAMATTSVGASALTAAELRLLPFLATHLSFPEIGERLYVSRHTVKTQAMSIYRKLGASSRSEAVRRATDSGLLGD